MNVDKSRYSFSRINLYKQCPFKFKTQYIDGYIGRQEIVANSPLVIGSAMHKGIEFGIDEAIKYYINENHVLSDKHIDEITKFEYWIPIIQSNLPNGTHEIYIEDETFRGYIDFIDDDGNMYDFKYSNNFDYVDSPQLSVYKYKYEQITGKKINNLYYIFIPKTFIRQKKTETVDTFRKRLMETLDGMSVSQVKVEYNEIAAIEFLNTIDMIESDEIFEKTPNKYCKYCEFKKYCEEGDMENMILPSAERRVLDIESVKDEKIKMWIYGQPFSGKTTFANKFEKPLVLSTDGNYKFIDSPVIYVKDEITTTGRLTTRVLAWEKFVEIIDELEKGENEFKTIIIDLFDGMYQHCRQKVFKDLGIDHESEDNFKSWSMIETTMVKQFQRLTNLDYNIILISHEDTTTDITKRGGDKITKIMPRFREKLQPLFAGMVDVVGRVYVESGEHKLSFLKDGVQVGGGRIQLDVEEIPLDYDEFLKVYHEAVLKSIGQYSQE